MVFDLWRQVRTHPGPSVCEPRLASIGAPFSWEAIVNSRGIWGIAGVVLCLAAVAGVVHLRGAAHVTAGAAASSSATSPVRATPSASASGAISAPPSGGHNSVATLHYVSNLGSDHAAAARLGYNLFDIGPVRSQIDALGPGQQALVWLGNLDNTDCTPGYSWAQFTAAVDRLASDAKVYGYYLSDEPHPRICPGAVADIRARADYIHAHTKVQKVFIVVLDAARECGTALGCEYAAMRPSVTHVDLIGVDPFPCGLTFCTPSRIDQEVQRAEAAGVPASAIVPVFQVFGQTCTNRQSKYYALPTVAELTDMLARWAALVPYPAFDFSYTWRSRGPACPALDRASGSHGYADLQSVMRSHNLG